MCDVHGCVLLADSRSSLQTGGAEVLVTPALVLVSTLPVAVWCTMRWFDLYGCMCEKSC